MATEGSILQGSALEIQMVDAAGCCTECEVEQSLTGDWQVRLFVARNPNTLLSTLERLGLDSVEAVRQAVKDRP